MTSDVDSPAARWYEARNENGERPVAERQPREPSTVPRPPPWSSEPQLGPGRYLILAAAVVMQLCLGATYSWSIFVDALKAGPGMSQAAAQVPFTVFYMVFPATLIVSGTLLGRLGPRRGAIIGGWLGMPGLGRGLQLRRRAGVVRILRGMSLGPRTGRPGLRLAVLGQYPRVHRPDAGRRGIRPDEELHHPTARRRRSPCRHRRRSAYPTLMRPG